MDDAIERGLDLTVGDTTDVPRNTADHLRDRVDAPRGTTDELRNATNLPRDAADVPRGTTDELRDANGEPRNAADVPRDAADADGLPRPWLGIHFECCGAYARIYRNAARSHYEGACPRCRRTLRVPIGPDGTAQRIFRAS